MKYETRNHYGFAGLIIGGILACYAILFTNGTTLAILLGVSVPIIILGGYMMTRAFTDEDKDHPDYDQYQQRLHDKDKQQ